MCSRLIKRLRVLAAGALLGLSAGASAGTCPGSNAIATIVAGTCWECLLPVSIGTISVPNSSFAYPDSLNPGGTIACYCQIGIFPYVGAEFGWWEPGYLVDVVREKGCAIGLNGTKIDLDTGGGGSAGALYSALRKQGVHNPQTDDNSHDSWYNAHIYQNYVASWLHDEMDNVCVLQDSQFVTYMTELDPTWNDDVLAAVFAPESALFTNLIAQMACAADCLTANLATSIDLLTWCAGCQGSVFPLSGHVPNHIGGVQASTLLMERLIYKLTRMGQMVATHAHFGQVAAWNGYCFQSADVMLHKQHYRSQIYLPVPSTSQPHVGGCCYPYGRSTTFGEMYREIPAVGEDWLHGLWQKRHCCAS